MNKLNQFGLAPLMIVIIAAVVLASGGAIYYFSQKPKTEPVITTYVVPTSSPTSSPSPSSTPKATAKAISKGTTTPKPTATPLSSPTASPSPTSGVYKVVASYDDTQVNLSLKTKDIYAEGGRVLVEDSNGNLIKDQSDFKFEWTVEDPSLIHFSSFSPTGSTGCVLELKSPCPEFDFVANPLDRTGTTKVHAKVRSISQDKIIGEVVFTVEVKD